MVEAGIRDLGAIELQEPEFLQPGQVDQPRIGDQGPLKIEREEVGHGVESDQAGVGDPRPVQVELIDLGEATDGEEAPVRDGGLADRDPSEPLHSRQVGDPAVGDRGLADVELFQVGEGLQECQVGVTDPILGKNVTFVTVSNRSSPTHSRSQT